MLLTFVVLVVVVVLLLVWLLWSVGQRHIDARARTLGALVLMTRDRMVTMSFDELIDACHRSGLVDWFIDREKLEYGFAESEPKTADFVFRVEYGNKFLIVEGHYNYYPVLLTASKDVITVELMPPLAPGFGTPTGRSARALVAAMSKFPGFMNMNVEMRMR
jgi:hypothetical protein